MALDTTRLRLLGPSDSSYILHMSISRQTLGSEKRRMVFSEGLGPPLDPVVSGDSSLLFVPVVGDCSVMASVAEGRSSVDPEAES